MPASIRSSRSVPGFESIARSGTRRYQTLSVPPMPVKTVDRRGALGERRGRRPALGLARLTLTTQWRTAWQR